MQETTSAEKILAKLSVDVPQAKLLDASVLRAKATPLPKPRSRVFLGKPSSKSASGRTSAAEDKSLTQVQAATLLQGAFRRWKHRLGMNPTTPMRLKKSATTAASLRISAGADSPNSADYDEMELDTLSMSHAGGVRPQGQEQEAPPSIAAAESALATQPPPTTTIPVQRTGSARRPPATDGHPATAAGSASDGSSHSSVFAPVAPADRGSQPMQVLHLTQSAGVTESAIIAPTNGTAPVDGDVPVVSKLSGVPQQQLQPQTKPQASTRFQEPQAGATKEKKEEMEGVLQDIGPGTEGGWQEGGNRRYAARHGTSVFNHDEENDGGIGKSPENNSPDLPLNATTAEQDAIVNNFVLKPMAPAITRRAWLKLQHAKSTQFSACNGAVVIDSDEVCFPQPCGRRQCSVHFKFLHSSFPPQIQCVYCPVLRQCNPPPPLPKKTEWISPQPCLTIMALLPTESTIAWACPV